MSETFSKLSKFISDPANSINQNESEIEKLLDTLKKLAESPVTDVSFIHNKKKVFIVLKIIIMSIKRQVLKFITFNKYIFLF